MEYGKFLEELIMKVAEEGASDLHLAVGRHPVLRISGKLISLEKKPILTPSDTEGLVEVLMGKEWYQEFLKNKERDFSPKHFYCYNTFKNGKTGINIRNRFFASFVVK